MRRSSSAWSEKSAGKLQYLVGFPQLLDLAIQFLDALQVGHGRPFPLLGVAFILAHLGMQGLRCAADLAGNRHDCRPLRFVSGAVLEHHPHRPLPDFR
jgi:hypothetical protein